MSFNHDNQKSQREIILDILQSGKSITVKDAFRYGIAHLPRRIKDLEDAGYIIRRETIKVEKANGRKTRVTKYSYSEANYQNQLTFNY